jgi:formylmethanofuran dehydrogenase subunit E-like metal-binding protein
MKTDLNPKEKEKQKQKQKPIILSNKQTNKQTIILLKIESIKNLRKKKKEGRRKKKLSEMGWRKRTRNKLGKKEKRWILL